MPTLFEASDGETSKHPSKKKSTGGIPPAGPTGRMSAFSFFVRNPAKLRFETQADDEVVELFLRQHPIVNVPWIILTVIFIIAPSVVFPFVLTFFPFGLEVPGSYLLIGTFFWYLATFGFALASFIHWFFNIYIVTNQRVVDIDFHYLLFKDFAEANVDKIQDLNYKTGGVLATIINYGTVYVQTASEIPNIEFELVPHPHEVVQVIRKLMNR